jgi:hypothetical protein
MNNGRSSASRMLVRSSVLGSACWLLFAACSGSDDEPRGGPGALPEIGDAKLQLERAGSCDDLLARIQDSILVQLEARAEQLRQTDGGTPGGGAPGFGGGWGVSVEDGAAEVVPVAQGAPPSLPPRAENDSANSAETPTSGAPSGAPSDPVDPAAPEPAPSPGAQVGGGFSGTTVQVKEVDEADIVKAEGDRIYLLHGGTLFVLRGWPADSTEILGSTLIEGAPVEMFVKDGKAVIFSRVYTHLGNDGNTGPGYPYYDYGAASYTKISVLDVADGEPSVVRESFVEGEYNAARRHDDLVRAVIQDGFKVPPLGSPTIEYRDPFGQPYPQEDIDAQVDAWLTRTARSIRSTELGDWLPREFEVRNDELVAVAPRCADYYSPDPGLTQTGITSVMSLDLADVSAPLRGATILGNAERVYSNSDVVLVTQTDYRHYFESGVGEQTIIHRFDIDGATTTYTASGAVPGSIHDQFSLDERAGIIRVSTTEQAWSRGGIAVPPAVSVPGAATRPTAPASVGPAEPMPDEPVSEEAKELPPDSTDVVAPEPTPAPQPVPPPPDPNGPVSRVLTLGTSGDVLEVLGQTEEFGAGEQIFSTRFLGDKGYVVTFRRTDPLFVIDLADPADPHVVGELHIPGFSDYLFPLDDDHLFAIGRDATPEGFVQGLALQIFDVSDPTKPELAHKHVFPDQGDSPANVDHRAIAFHPDRGVVAFPHLSYQTGESTVEVFELSSATGFVRLGGMGMSDMLDLDVCIQRYFGYPPGAELDELRAQVEGNPAWERDVLASCRYGQSFRRGLFRDDFIYGISNTGVYVYDFTAIEAGAVGQVSLPPEVYVDSAFGNGDPIGTPAPVPVPDIGAGGSANANSGGAAGASFDGGEAGSAAAGAAGAAGASFD